MKEGAIHEQTDRSFQQKFWRNAFIYANILEKDEITADQVEEYCALRRSTRQWMDAVQGLEQERIEFMRLRRKNTLLYKLMMVDYTV